MSGDRHSGMDPEFERIVTAARATHREALDRLAATDRCSHGENPDPNCHWCRPLSSTPPRPEDCAHESLVRTKDARWYCGACGVWFVPEDERRVLSPEALLVWEAVRRLEQHTDIGPGNVGPLLMQVNLRQYEHALSVLREGGYEIIPTTTPARTTSSEETS